MLYKHGGTYMDTDAHPIWPLARIIRPETDEQFLHHQCKEATNYFIASKPSNTTIKALIDETLHRIEYSSHNNICNITGPAIFEAIQADREHQWHLGSHSCLQGNYSNNFFKYIDKPEGRWTSEQQRQRVVTP
jgi:mannosyltransferase OCH1-like enzyme